MTLYEDPPRPNRAPLGLALTLIDWALSVPAGWICFGGMMAGGSGHSTHLLSLVAIAKLTNLAAALVHGVAFVLCLRGRGWTCVAGSIVAALGILSSVAVWVVLAML